MNWFYRFTNKMAVRYVAYKTGIVFATAVGGYLATVLIQKLRQRSWLTSTQPVAAITKSSKPPQKKKKKRRRRRKHRPIKYPNSLSSDSESSEPLL